MIFFFNSICISFNMHSSLSKVRRQDVLWLVGPGRGVAMTHRPVSTGKQTQSGSHWRAVDTSSGRLPGKLQAADKKEEQHLAFSERGRSENSVPFRCKQFCSAFHMIFVVILAKFLVIIDIFFIQNKISIYMILSFLTMYRSAKKSTSITFTASVFPTHPCCLQLAKFERSAEACFQLATFTLTPPETPIKVIKYAACFPTWPNFQGE